MKLNPADWTLWFKLGELTMDSVVMQRIFAYINAVANSVMFYDMIFIT